MRRILFSLIIIIALLGNINIADAQYAHPGTAIKTNDGNVQSDITGIKSDIASSTAEIQAIRDNLNTHEIEIANATAEISALRTNDQTQEIEIAQVTAEISAIRSNLDTLEDLVNSNQAWTTAEIAAITSEIETIRLNMTTLENLVNANYSALFDNLGTHENEINAIKLNLQTQENELTNIKINIDTIEDLVNINFETLFDGLTTLENLIEINYTELFNNLGTQETLIATKADSDEIHADISQAYVNVKEFGAVGDGIVDDAAAINNAIASLTSGGVVLFPSGYYCIKSQITLTGKSGLTLRGVGHGENTTYLGTNIYATGYNGYHFRGIDCVGVSIENMNLTAEGQDSSFAVGGIYFSISSNSNNPYHSFKNLFISDISNNGISIGTPIMTNFNNVTVRKCVGSAFNLWSGTSTTWTNCYANNATEAGWLLTGMTYCTLQGCAAESAGVGYYFDNSKSISVMGCGTEAIINRGGAFNGYAYRSINGSNAITLYDCYDRISETGTFSESAGGLLDYINHKTDSNAQITKIHSLPASTSTYTDTYSIGAVELQTALDTVAVWLNSVDLRLDSNEIAINLLNIDNDSQDVSIEANRLALVDVNIELGSISVAINNLDLRLGAIELILAGGSSGEVLTKTDDSFTWATIPSGVTDHTLLSNIGTKTHLELEQDILDLQANPAGVSRVYVNGVALPTGEVEFKEGNNIALNITGSTVEITSTGGSGGTVEAILNSDYAARSQGTAESGLFSIYDFDITSSIIVTDTVVPTINGLVQYETTHFAISTWDDGGTNKLRITFANDVSADALVRVSCFTTLPLLAVISADNVSTDDGWLQDGLDAIWVAINDRYTKAEADATLENAIAAIPTPSVNQTVTVTAGEALTAGQVVSLINESGTMKAYNNPLTVSASPNGAESVFNAAATTYCSAVALDSTRFLVTYADSDTYPKAIVGTVTGSTIAWGSESAAFENVAATYLSACKIGTDKIFVAYKNGTTDIRMVVLTVSTATITVGSPATLNNNYGTYVSATTLDTDKALVCYNQSESGTTGEAKIVTVSTTTPTPYPAAGTAGTEFNAAATAYISVSALSSTSAIVAYQDGGNSNFGTAQILSISGTTITPGTEYVFKEAASDWCFASALSSSTAVVGCRVDSLATGYTFFVPDTTTALTFTSGATYDNGSYRSASKIDSTHFIFVWSGNSNYGKQAIGTISSGVISFGSIATLQSASTFFLSAAYLGSNKSAIVYKDAGNSDYGTCCINTWATASYDSVAGISQGAYSSGDTATVLIKGTDTNQSALIYPTTYYLQSDMSIGTTPVSLGGSFIRLGISKSATELIMD